MLGVAGWILVCLCFGSVLGNGLMWLLSKAGVVLGSTEKNLVDFVVGSLSLQGPVLVLAGLFLRRHELAWSEAFGFGRTSPRRCVGQAVAAVSVILPTAMMLGAVAAVVLTRLGFKPEMQPAVRMLSEGPPTWHLIVYGLGAVVLAPLAEEVLFRGLLYPALRRVCAPATAVWMAALPFAGMHFNAMAFLPMTFLAVTLTWLYERTENLLTAILAHALFNGVSFSLLVTNPDWAKPFLSQ